MLATGSLRTLPLALAAALLLLAAPSAWALPDFDGDGVAAGDCAPTDPAVFPGALDRPDLAFEDVDCDGIDGHASRAVFVAPGGDDAAPGTREAPKRTIGAALSAGRDVYVAGGTYEEAVAAVDGVGIYGGYAPGSWARSTAQVTTIAGSPQAVLAEDDQGVVLQLLRLRGSPSDGDRSAYGLRVTNGSRAAIAAVDARAADAREGGAGAPGANAPASLTGTNGSCANGAPGPGGGAGARDNAGGAGGIGESQPQVSADGSDGLVGAGSDASPGDGGSRGLGSADGMPGEDGGDGADGRAGTNLPFATDGAAAAWLGVAGTAGTAGTSGAGGGGGGGGGQGPADVAGGGGSGGGSGGGGGQGGSPGLAGGGSFGSYVHASWLVATDATLVGGGGGRGGDGGPAGQGQPGAGGGNTVLCPGVGSGGAGGSGGDGGAGGPGGAGTGGPSAGVFRTSGGSAYAARGGTRASAGPAGAGGRTGGNGDQAEAGDARDVFTAEGTPGDADADFDGDGVLDRDDACPEIAAPGGCPVRPAKLPDADGDGIPDGLDACPAVPRGHDPNEDGCPDGPPPPPPVADAPPPPAPAPRARPARVSAAVAFRFSNRGRSTVFSSLQVRRITGGATVVVQCAGKGCPVRRFIKRRAAGTLSLRPFVRKRLRAGTVLRVRVTRAGFVGLALDVAIRARRPPRVTKRCLPPGGGRPQRC